MYHGGLEFDTLLTVYAVSVDNNMT